ncbi:MAG: hypothetical protein WB992_09860, partial [Bryobacteraceae bacterium]
NAETSATDPLNENFCRFGTGRICQGFLWQWGVMNPLPALGGNNSYAAGDNNKDQVVGWAETGKHDSTCLPGHVLQYEAVIWGPEKGQIQELPPLPGDPDGAAVGINDNSQVVGISGPCGDDDGLGARHAVLWENGAVIDMGGLGGNYFNTGVAINSKGVVVGFSDLKGDENGDVNFHAFIWTKTGGMRDLGTLPGDKFSEATGINEAGQIVGESCDANFNCTAVLWQSGKTGGESIIDLNSLIPPLSPLYLFYANDINDRGEIAGEAYDQSTNESPAFAGLPTRAGEDNDAASFEPAGARAVPRVILPANIREQLKQRLKVGHF